MARLLTVRISLKLLQDKSGKPDYDLPKSSQVASSSPSDSMANANGTVDVTEKARWERVGWAPRFGSGDAGDDDETTMLDHQTWLEGKLDDKFFGGAFFFCSQAITSLLY